MKRLFMAGLILLAVLFASGCDSLRTIRGTGDITAETREVSDFSAVNLAGIGNVVVEYGAQEGLRIEAEENLLPYLESEVEGDTLTLGIREGVNIVPTQAIFYYLTVRDLDEARVTGLGNIDVPRLEGSTVALKISGGGDIHVDEVQAKRLEVDLSGLGNLNIGGGMAANSDVKLSGAGNYDATGMASEVVSVEVSGLGSASVWAKDALNAKISGGGSVSYAGKPDVTKEITGLGDVRSVGEVNG